MHRLRVDCTLTLLTYTVMRAIHPIRPQPYERHVGHTLQVGLTMMLLLLMMMTNDDALLISCTAAMPLVTIGTQST